MSKTENEVRPPRSRVASAGRTRAKGADGFCPYGPWITTADEVPDPHDLGLRTWVNGELRQDARTSDLIFSIPELIAFLRDWQHTWVIPAAGGEAVGADPAPAYLTGAVMLRLPAMPPKKPEAILAMPCPILSCRLSLGVSVKSSMICAMFSGVFSRRPAR